MIKGLLVLLTVLCCTTQLFSQFLPPLLKFSPAQQFRVSLNLKTTVSQQAMGQAIDFNVEATGDHRFSVTNATDENTTLHHDVNRLRFTFDGMGQKRAFDSNQDADMKGPFGPYAKEILDKTYDMVIDPRGQTLMVMPESISITVQDPRIALINTMLRDVVGIAFPPGKNEPGFFHLFPNDTLKTGLTWTRSTSDSSGQSLREVYRIAEMTDSLIRIDYQAESVSVTKAEMMGNEAITTLNNKSTGTITVDALTGILLEKLVKTESNGNSETPFGAIPVTSKSDLRVVVKTSAE